MDDAITEAYAMMVAMNFAFASSFNL
jgi:hypothetical protein